MPDFDALDLTGLLARYGSTGPGHAIGLYRGGELVRHACQGNAVVEHDVAVSADTVFDIASASKQFTAACMLLLQRDGALSLDDDVRSHVPELRLDVPVTIRQCLSHTAGLRDYLSLCELAGVPTAGIDENRFTRLVAGQAELDFPPGTSWSYSNTGFALCAVVVRRVTGRSLAQFAADRVFGPLGMQATRFRDDLGVLVPGLATGYSPARDDGWRRVDIVEETVGDGAIVTSVRDLAGWQRFMLTGAVLGADIRDAMLEPAVLADGRRLPYALGLEVMDLGGRTVYLHSGYIGGFRSALVYLLDEGAGIAVLANRDDTSPVVLAVTIARQLAGLGIPSRPARLGAADALGAQAAVCGLWYSPVTGTHIVISPGPEGTVTQSDGEWSVRYAAMTDGSWHGAELNDLNRLRLDGGALICEEVVGDEAPEIFVRAGGADQADQAIAAGFGSYYSEELAACATLGPGASGHAVLSVGLAAPRVLAPGFGGSWTGGGVTVVLAADDALEISMSGALRCRFARLPGEPPERQRGL
jgi:CubicO group peptidase (beta-lactamase class C family)